MPIEFACDCGKMFKVPAEYAGKRSKCTACGKPVVVPTSPSKPPATAEASAEDDALRALTEGADPEPAPRMPGGYTGVPAGGLPGAAPSTPRQAPPPQEDTGSTAAARALANASALEKLSRSKLRGKGKTAQPHKEGIRFELNWLRIGIGAFIVTAGVVWLVLGMSGVLGSIKKFPGIWPSLLIVGGVVTLASGFIGYTSKNAQPDE